MAMLKTDIVDAVAKKTGLTKKAASEAVEAMISSVIDSLKAGTDVMLTGFGKFYVSEVAAKQGINPQTLKPLTIAAHSAPKFKAGKALKDAVK